MLAYVVACTAGTDKERDELPAAERPSLPPLAAVLEESYQGVPKSAVPVATTAIMLALVSTASAASMHAYSYAIPLHAQAFGDSFY